MAEDKLSFCPTEFFLHSESPILEKCLKLVQDLDAASEWLPNSEQCT